MPNESQYNTWAEEPLHLHDYISNTGKLGAGTKKGRNIDHDVTRERAATIPVIFQLQLKSWKLCQLKVNISKMADMQRIQKHKLTCLGLVGGHSVSGFKKAIILKHKRTDQVRSV